LGKHTVAFSVKARFYTTPGDSIAAMLGPPKLRALDQPVTISLESLVPPNHFYRHLDAALDLSCARLGRRPLWRAGPTVHRPGCVL
jgi:hypothetical protein